VGSMVTSSPMGLLATGRPTSGPSPNVPPEKLAELVLRGAEAKLRELEAQDRAHAQALETFVSRLGAGPQPDRDKIRRIRHASRHP
jgi:hypothetical protein